MAFYFSNLILQTAMYKAGKHWLISGITVMGIVLGGQVAYADTPATVAATTEQATPTARPAVQVPPAPVASAGQPCKEWVAKFIVQRTVVCR